MLGALLGGLLAGGLSAAGTAYQAKKAKDAAGDQQVFQQRMSDTAHQREMADMRKAGLNPILSAGGQGASSPAGAMAVVPNIGASMAQGLTSGASTAQQIEASHADILLKEANKSFVDAKTAITENLLPGSEAISVLTNAAADVLKSIDKMVRSNTEMFRDTIEAGKGLLNDLKEKFLGSGGSLDIWRTEVKKQMKKNETFFSGELRDELYNMSEIYGDN